MLFKIVHGAQCVLKIRGGVYKQVDVYVYGDRLFAKNGAGYIGLHTEGLTSAPAATWEHLDGVEYRPGQGKNFGKIVPKHPIEMAAR